MQPTKREKVLKAMINMYAHQVDNITSARDDAKKIIAKHNEHIITLNNQIQECIDELNALQKARE